jgi:hypothetical protein
VTKSVLSEQQLRQGLILFAALQIVQGMWQALLPGVWYEAFADFGPRDDHLVRDASAAYIASAIALAMSVNRRSWRVPVLLVVTITYAIHAINHLFDIANADPGWIGPADFVFLALATAVVAYMLRSAAKGAG